MFRRKRCLCDMSERQFKREIKRVIKEAQFILWSNRYYDVDNPNPDRRQ